jgi:signal peptidase II
MMWALLLIVGVVVLDQLTKWWVVASFRMFESVELIPGFLSLTRRFNTGAAWSLLEGQTAFFIVLTIIALGLFSVLLWQAYKQKEQAEMLGMALMIGGAIGNFIDRVRFGGVIDFIDVMIVTYDFPVFNVADSALTVGVGLYILGVFLHEQRTRHSE